MAVSILGAPAAPAAPPSDPRQDYALKAEKLGDKKAPSAWIALADFAEQHLLLEEREEALRKVIAQAPDHPEAHRRLDEIKVAGVWLPVDVAEAKEIDEKQSKGLVYYGDKWLPAKEADQLRATDRKSERWPLDFRMDTPRLKIFSSCPVAFTWKVAAILENEIDVYRSFYGTVWKLQSKLKPLKVYFFGNREEFSKQVGIFHDGPIPEWMAGYYSSVNQTLYVCHSTLNAPQEIERTVTANAVHEMVHALDDLLAQVYVYGLQTRPLAWIFEGRAEHFGRAVVGRRVLPGACRSVYGNQPSDLAKGLSSMRLSKLLELDSESLMKQDALPRCAVSWAWVHFLFHGDGGSHAEGFRGFLKGCSQGKFSLYFLDVAIGDVSGLVDGFEAHVHKVLLPALKVAAGAPSP